MEDFPSKVTTETGSPSTQTSQQGGNSLRGMASNVVTMVDLSFVRSIPAILMLSEIVRSHCTLFYFSFLSVRGQTSALLTQILGELWPLRNPFQNNGRKLSGGKNVKGRHFGSACLTEQCPLFTDRLSLSSDHTQVM